MGVERDAREDRDRSAAEQRTSPLWAELDSELVGLEQMVMRAAQAITLVGIGIAIYVALFVAPAMGRAMGIAAAGTLVWFTIAHALLARGRGARVLSIVNPVFEIAVPAIALVIMEQTQGVAYALGSWVPPLLYAVLIFLAMMRLKPWQPIIVGIVGAVGYVAAYALVLRNAPLLATLDSPLYKPPMQAARAASIIGFGILGSLACFGMRRAIARAARQTRAKELFGKYRLGAKIASGGMGTVYEALYCPEGGFERRVAIKRVHPHLALDPAFVDGFRAEAELGARLAHPNIVAVLDFGLEGDTYFFAMELVEGMDLSRLRKHCKAAQTPLPQNVVAFIGREIAAGLAFAHETALGADGKPLHVVHRDLNPANVLISKTGQVKISDFGVAKALRDQRSHETTHVVGKLAYLAPETARGAAVDARADLFALGLIVWELLCLQQAFAKDGEAATLDAIVNSVVPPPSTVRDELAGTKWDSFCATALQPDPARRFQSAREMRDALDRILDDTHVPRADEIAAILRAAAASPDISGPSLVATRSSAETRPIEPPTVRMPHLDGK